MEWLRNLFITNNVVVYAIYGQVFFTLGVALAVQSMKYTSLHLGKQLRWLSAFGLSHGLVEWGYVFIPIQATYLPAAAVEALRWLQLALLTCSFAFLFQFGLRTAIRTGPLAESAWGWFAASVLAAVAAVLGLVDPAGNGRIGIEVWVRYLMAVPGAAAGAQGIFHAAQEVESMQLPRISRWLRISAASLAGYAFMNLVTPEHHYFLSPWLNYDALLHIFGVPVQIWRTVVGMGILYGMIRSLHLFEIEMDRLLQTAQQRKLLEAERELGIMNQIAIALGRARNPRLAMGAALERLVPFLHCSEGEIVLREDEGQSWRPMVRVEGTRVVPAGDGWSPPPLVAAVALEERVIIRALAPDRFAVGLPIRVGNRLVAVACLSRLEPIELSGQEVQVVESVGNLLGVALENSRLWAEVQRKEAARTEWISRIITAQEDERRRIAHELHDEVVQALVVLCRRLDAVADVPRPLPEPMAAGLAAARQQAEDLINALRNFARDLRPPALDDLGLVASVRRLLADMGDRTGIRWDLRTAGRSQRLPRNIELGLFRIAQEAIRNAERHARARTLVVELRFGEDQAGVRVRDDGTGMTLAEGQQRPAHTTGLGLLGMEERAALLGGKLEVVSQPGRGTTIRVTVPLQTDTFAASPQPA